MRNTIILLLGIVVISLLTIKGCIAINKKANSEQKKLLKENISYQKELQQQRDEKDRLHTVINSYKTTVTNLAITKDAEISALRSEVKRLKNLHSITRASYQVEGTFTAPISKADITGQDSTQKAEQATFSFQDRYLSISGQIYPDTVKGHYTYQDRFTIKKEYHKKGFWKQPELIVSAYPENPAASFPDLQDITIEPNKKKWYQTKAFAFASGLLTGAMLVYKN